MCFIRCITLTFLCLLLFAKLQAQDISGSYIGELTLNDKSYSFHLTMELVQNGSHLSGVSKIVGISENYVVYNIEGEVSGNSIKLDETTARDYANGTGGVWSWCVKEFTGTFQRRNGMIILSGSWHNQGAKIFSEGKYFSGNYCYPGMFMLSALDKPGSAPIKPVTMEGAGAPAKAGLAQDGTGGKVAPDGSGGRTRPAVNAPVRAFTGTKLVGRKIAVLDSLVVDQPDVTVSLYDNGEIDGDTITVYLNDQLLTSRRRLSDTAIELHLKLQPNTSNVLTMYANNLGSIPPNTAVMVVKAGELRKEVFISSDKSKSGAIKFVYSTQTSQP